MCWELRAKERRRPEILETGRRKLEPEPLGRSEPPECPEGHPLRRDAVQEWRHSEAVAGWGTRSWVGWLSYSA